MTAIVNIKSQNQYWLFLYPFIHLEIKNDWAVLYNTLNGKILECKGNPGLINILKKLKTNRNLYVTGLKGEQIISGLKVFINDLRDLYMGDIIPKKNGSRKPVQFMPVPTIESKFSVTKGISRETKLKLFFKNSLNDYLETLNIFINSNCHLNCRSCGSGYKQFLSCTTRTGNGELPLEDLKNLFNELKGSRVNKVNILGGNIFDYTRFEGLVSALAQETAIQKEYYVHYKNLDFNASTSVLFSTKNKQRINIIVDFPLNRESLAVSVKKIQGADFDYRLRFIVTDDVDVALCEGFVAKNGIDEETVELVPFFNGNNIEFFKENVFVTKEDIEVSLPTHNDIFARSVFNTFFFANITIFPDKRVFSNLHNSSLGLLGSREFFLLIAQELKQAKSWGLTRKKVSPCKQCPYQALCPPISNYEYAIGRFNSCHLCEEER